MSEMCPTIWTHHGHILDTVWTFQITLGTCHEDVQKLSKSFGHFIPLWTLFGQVLDKFWTSLMEFDGIRRNLMEFDRI